MQQVKICIIFNALPRVTTKFLIRKYNIFFFSKIETNARERIEIATIMISFKILSNMKNNISDITQKEKQVLNIVKFEYYNVVKRNVTLFKRRW